MNVGGSMRQNFFFCVVVVQGVGWKIAGLSNVYGMVQAGGCFPCKYVVGRRAFESSVNAIDPIAIFFSRFSRP